MKKLLLFAALFCAQQAICQTIPNNSFETWATAGPFFSPSGWAGGPGVKQSNQPHTGSWALQCSVDTITNPSTSTLDTVAGSTYSGAMTMGPPVPGAPLPGFATTSRPDSLTGFFKYHALGTDTCTIVATLSRWNTTSHVRETVGFALFTNGINDSVYKRFSVPLTYLLTATPDTCVVQVMCANQQAPKHMGTTVWVDDLAFANHSTVEVNTINTGNAAMVYPNPFSSILNVTESENAKIAAVELFNLAGQQILQTTGKTLNTSGLPNGNYFLSIRTNDGKTEVRQVVKQ